MLSDDAPLAVVGVIHPPTGLGGNPPSSPDRPQADAGRMRKPQSGHHAYARPGTEVPRLGQILRLYSIPISIFSSQRLRLAGPFNP